MNIKSNIDVLIVEDEFINAQFLEQVLTSLGFQSISVVSNAKDALAVVLDKDIDFAFMDINLEGPIDGIHCAQLINKKFDIPIIYTTAYGDSKTIEEASQTNVAGYLIKPFDSQDVEAVCSIVLKNLSQKRTIKDEEDETTIELSNEYLFDSSNMTLIKNGTPLKLTKKEASLLMILCKHENSCVSFETIKNFVWQDKVIRDSTLRDTVSRLRKKIAGVRIESFSSMGYCLRKVIS